MAVLQGISGIQMGDGAGGTIALSISKHILRMLSNSSLSYLTATMSNPSQVNSGSVSYYIPELIQTEAYDATSQKFDKTQTAMRRITCDTREQAKYEVETFDIARLDESSDVLGMIATGLAMGIQSTLNAEFLMYIKSQFEVGGELAAQIIELPVLGKDVVDTVENCRAAYNALQMKIAKITQMYDKNKLGIEKGDLHTIMSPVAAVQIRNSFWGTPANIGNFPISPTLAGVQLGNMKFTEDGMLDNAIPAGTSFSKLKDFDFSNYVGFIIHNEAVAMPISIMNVVNQNSPFNANLQYICKYQYGLGILRPKLLYAIVKAKPVAKKETIKEKFGRNN